MALRSVLLGVGSYLPKRILSNAELAKQVDTSDEWIRERSGVESRYYVETGTATSDLGVTAAREAIGEDEDVVPLQALRAVGRREGQRGVVTTELRETGAPICHGRPEPRD